MPKPNVMPSGSALPQVDNTGDAGKSEPVEKILGKFDTPEDLAAAYTNLEGLLDKQGGEVGQLRQQITDLSKVTATDEGAPEAGQPTSVEQEKAIVDQVDKGDLSVGEGLAAIAKLTRETTQTEMESKFNDYDTDRNAQDLYDNFVDDNPLFQELEASGKLDEVMKTNPMHDKFSAFFALKAELDSAAAFNKGQEEALRIAKGGDGVKQVLSGPGSQSRETPAPKRGMSQGEQANGMMAAMANARAQ